MCTQKFIEDFVRPARREHYLGLLSHRKKVREKFQRHLDHHIVEDLRSATSVPISQQNIADIELLLASLGASQSCFVISSNSKINGTTLNTHDALEATIGYGFGTVLYFPTKGIAYYESEDRNARYILRS